MKTVRKAPGAYFTRPRIVVSLVLTLVATLLGGIPAIAALVHESEVRPRFPRLGFWIMIREWRNGRRSTRITSSLPRH